MNFSNTTRKALQPCLALRGQESLSTLSLPSGDMCNVAHMLVQVSILGLGSWQDLPGKAVRHHGTPEKKDVSPL
uniref:Uncharacterized protein n=1 Tax=Saimiri boliviensis boliviensis TaxID=39432 RepID=A0A2K6TZM5_SAIBB